MTTLTWLRDDPEPPSPKSMSDAVVVHQPSSIHTASDVVDRCRRGKAAALVVVSTVRVYGADPGHDMHFDELTPIAERFDDADLADLATADAEFADLAARQTKRTRMPITVLRPAHVVAGTHRSPLVAALRKGNLRARFGYDPIVDLLHDEDLDDAIESAASAGIRGVFNVAGPGSLPISVLAREVGTARLVGPGALVARLKSRLGMGELTDFAESELCYPIIVSDGAFRSATGWEPSHSLPETVEAMREAAA